MKKILSILVCVFLFTSCATDKEASLMEVKSLFPKAKIYRVEGTSFTFYVIDSVTVRRVKCVNFTNNGISDIETLIEIK